MSKKLQSLRDNLCEELEKVARKEEMSTQDLELVDTLTHSIKNLDKVMLGNEMIDEYGYDFDNYSRDYSYARRGGRRGRDGDNDGRYNEGRSREGRSYDDMSRDNRSYGRSYNDRSYGNNTDTGYSGHYDEKSIERFKHMMQDAIHEL